MSFRFRDPPGVDAGANLRQLRNLRKTVSCVALSSVAKAG